MLLIWIEAKFEENGSGDLLNFPPAKHVSHQGNQRPGLVPSLASQKNKSICGVKGQCYRVLGERLTCVKLH